MNENIIQNSESENLIIEVNRSTFSTFCNQVVIPVFKEEEIENLSNNETDDDDDDCSEEHNIGSMKILKSLLSSVVPELSIEESDDDSEEEGYEQDYFGIGIEDDKSFMDQLISSGF